MIEMLNDYTHTMVLKPWLYFLLAFGVYLLISIATLAMKPGGGRRAIQGLAFSLLITPMPVGVHNVLLWLPAAPFLFSEKGAAPLVFLWMLVFFFIGYAVFPWFAVKFVSLLHVFSRNGNTVNMREGLTSDKSVTAHDRSV